MPEMIPVNAELFAAVQSVAPLPPIVANALGALEVQAGGADALGYFLRVTDAFAQAYIVTRGTFLLAEVAKTGERQIVAVPVRRVRQVIESEIDRAHKIEVEIDAGTTTLINTHVPSPIDPEAEVNVRVTHFTKYTIEAGAEESEALRRFGAALRMILATL